MNGIVFPNFVFFVLSLLMRIFYLYVPVFLSLLSSAVFAQNIPPFVVNGSASQLSSLCYRLTPELTGQAGSIWSEQQIDLTQSFEAEALLYLGCSAPVICFEDSDDGADGIVFAFQPLSTAVGTVGGGMGIEGVIPSLCIEFDTYPNANNNDPLFDHIRIFANGDLDHASPNSLTAAVPMIDAATNAEDCNEHTLNVSWDAPSQTMNVYFDCELKLTYTGDVLNNIFGGNPDVFWGFTSATGLCTNEQRVCINTPPTFQVNDTTICAGQSVQLSGPANATSYLWTPGTGLSNPNIANPVATPDATTTYNLAITNDCNFVTNFEVTITVLPQPNAAIDTFLCAGNLIFVGGFPYNSAGTYTVSFPMPAGCDSVLTINITEQFPSNFEIFDSICTGNSYILPDLTIATTAGDYQSVLQNVAGCDSTITVHLAVNAPDCNDNDCNTGDTLDSSTCSCLHTSIPPPDCNDNDCNTEDAYDATSCICTHTPVIPTDCNDNDCNTEDAYDTTSCTCTHTPVTPPDCNDGNAATLDIYVTATCTCQHEPIATDIVIVPNAFSPNNDGINDVLRPFGPTLLTVDFRIYNRWGQKVFESDNPAEGWNGMYKNTIQEIGVYVYTLSYTTVANPVEVQFMHGNITLLR